MADGTQNDLDEDGRTTKALSYSNLRCVHVDYDDDDDDDDDLRSVQNTTHQVGKISNRWMLSQMVHKTTNRFKGREFTDKKEKKYEKCGNRICEKEYLNELLTI